MVDVQTISIAVASAGVFVAAIYYVLQIRHQRKMRQTDLIMRLYSTWGGREFQEALFRHLAINCKDYDDFVKKYGPTPSQNTQSLSEVQISIQMVGTFLEGLGVLLSEKLVDINLIQKLFAVKVYWEKTEPLMKELRKRHDPGLWEWFEYLYNEVKRREQQLASKPT